MTQLFGDIDLEAMANWIEAQKQILKIMDNMSKNIDKLDRLALALSIHDMLSKIQLTLDEFIKWLDSPTVLSVLSQVDVKELEKLWSGAYQCLEKQNELQQHIVLAIKALIYRLLSYSASPQFLS